ncbi:unnamed protein product, partial [Prorocentrum cordatum]
EPGGGAAVPVSAQSHKLKWSQDAAIGNGGDVGVILCHRVQQLHEDYLERHCPVLVESLGAKARCDRAFAAKEDGEGQNIEVQQLRTGSGARRPKMENHHCEQSQTPKLVHEALRAGSCHSTFSRGAQSRETAVPGCWGHGQIGGFSREVLDVPFGSVGGRAARGALSRDLSENASRCEAEPAATYLQLHRSSEIRSEVGGLARNIAWKCACGPWIGSGPREVDMLRG